MAVARGQWSVVGPLSGSLENQRRTSRLDATSVRRRVVAVRLDLEFLGCLSDPAFLMRIRRVLIATYFADPGERAALYTLVGMPVPPDDQVKSDARLYKADRERGREARFRLIVVPAYNYTCALTGYR